MDKEYAEEIFKIAKEHSDSPYFFISYILEEANAELDHTKTEEMRVLKDSFLTSIANWYKNILGGEV